MRTVRGFTLIELMIVVAIIAILAALAIPNFLASKKMANEASAMNSLRTISTACATYRSKNSTYPANLAVLLARGFVDAPLGNGTRSGYGFGSAGGGANGNLNGTPDTWSCYAVPLAIGTSGDRYFRIAETGVLEGSTNGGATWAPID